MTRQVDKLSAQLICAADTPPRQCNGSDVFGSDICTCRPYLIFGIEEAVKEAQNGGSGVVIYFRKEGRALGEVTKVGGAPVQAQCCTTGSHKPRSTVRPRSWCCSHERYPRLVHCVLLVPLTEIGSRVQRPQAWPGSCVGLLQADRKRRRGQGHALPGSHAGYPALARHYQD